MPSAFSHQDVSGPVLEKKQLATINQELWDKHLHAAFSRNLEATLRGMTWWQRLGEPNSLQQTSWYKEFMKNEQIANRSGTTFTIGQLFKSEDIFKIHPIPAALIDKYFPDFFHLWDLRSEELGSKSDQLNRKYQDLVKQSLPPWREWVYLHELLLTEWGKETITFDELMRRWERGYKDIWEKLSVNILSDNISRITKEIDSLQAQISAAEINNEKLLRKHGLSESVRAAAAAHFDNTRQLAKSVRVSIEAEVLQYPDCPYCGQSLGELWHADHIWPVSRGGLSTINNMVAICISCNNKKSDLTLREFILQQGLDRDEVEIRLVKLGKRF